MLEPVHRLVDEVVDLLRDGLATKPEEGALLGRQKVYWHRLEGSEG